MAVDSQVLAGTRNFAGARAARSLDKTLSHDEFQALLRERLKASMPEIISVAEAQALQGDKDARGWLIDRAYGKASQNVDVSGVIEHHYEGQVNVAVLAAQAALELKKGKT